MKNLKIKQINFNYDKEIVEIFYTIGNCHYVAHFSFIDWMVNGHFNEKDMVNLLAKHG